MNDQYKNQEGEQQLPNVPDRSTEPDDSARPIQIQYNDKDPFTAQDEFVGHYIEKEFTKWDSWRKPWENLWNECYKLYLNISEMMKTPTRARIFIPAVFQVIEAAVPKIMTLIFGDTEFFDVVADDPKRQGFADIIKRLLKYQLMKADFFLKFIDYTKQLLMYGTSYFYVYWKVERKWVHKRTPIRGPKTFGGFTISNNAIIGWKEEKVYEVTERRPEVEVLDVLDVYPDPEARSEKDSRAIWVRSWMDLSEVKELGAGNYPVFDPQNVLRIEHGTKNTLSESRQVRNSMRGLQTGYVDSNQVELLTRWGLCDLDGDGIREETLIVIANRKYLLRAMPNPFDHQKRPILKSTLFPVPLEWFGIGLIEPIIPLQHELNTIRRQRLDNVNLILNRMWKVNSFADIDMETLVSSPNGIILTDDMNAVEALETANVTQDAYNEAALIQNDIDSATTPKSVQGTPNSGSLGRTAKGAQLIIGQALEKFGTATKLAEESGIKRMLRMMHQLNEQFIDSEEMLNDPSGYGKLFTQLEFPVTPEMIRAEVSFQMKGISEMINAEAKINQIVSFQGVYGPALAPESTTALMKKMWKLMGFDPDEVNLAAVAPLPELREAAGEGATDANVAQIKQNGQMNAVPGVASQPKG
jgi:hypothetical protein